MQEIYNTDFYNEHKDISLLSAKVIVSLILDVFPVKSVLDVGCGIGTWLSIFLKHGIREIKGFDANNLPEEYYFIDKEKIETGCDFSSANFEINCKSDLAICLEVAEHLPQSSADNLIKNLTNAAPIVIFSAAFPGQTGVNHINEQPPWYWRKKFNLFKYVEIDFLRPLIWSDDKVSWWYRQNITSFVSLNLLESNKEVKDLYLRFEEHPGTHHLTIVSETILKKLFSEMERSKKPLQKIRSFFKDLL